MNNHLKDIVQGILAIDSNSAMLGKPGVVGGNAVAGASAPTRRTDDCIHLGAVLSRTDASGRPRLCTGCWLMECEVFGNCRVTEKWDGATCSGCQSYTSQSASIDEPTSDVRPTPHKTLARFDHHNLAAGKLGYRFNASIIRGRGGYLFCYRDGWAGSNLWVVRLNDCFRPTAHPPVRLDILHSDCTFGREDPRFFVHDGRLHVAFIGVVGGGGCIKHTNQMYALLTNDLKVEAAFSPADYPPGRGAANPRMWQKNWQFFSHGGQLYAVYSIAPHQILRIDGDRVELAYNTPTHAPWRSGAEMRGGASPVLVDGEWYCWFHSKHRHSDGKLIYEVGVYTFEDRPPFRIRRITPEPVIVADPSTNKDNYCHCIFVCGAVLDGVRWVISAGIHDRWSEIHAVDATDVERRLVRIGTPPWWSDHGPGTVDLDVFMYVNDLDEYRVWDFDFRSGAVVDVGGHVGSFAHLAWSRRCPAVHTFEPVQSNLSRLYANATHMPGVVVHPQAVMAVPGMVYCHPPRHQPENTGAWYVDTNPPGEVAEACSLDGAIKHAEEDAPVVLIKIDCEQGEADMIAASTRLGGVRRVVGEWHDANGPGAVRAALEAHGFVVETTGSEPWSSGLFFACRS